MEGRSMYGIVGAIIPILLSVALMILGSGALNTLIGIRLDGGGYTPFIIGIITAAYYTGLTLGSLGCSRLITRVGHIRAFAAFASVFSTATLGHGLTGDIYIWGALRFVEGFCLAGIYMCVESWLNDKATNETRGKILSQYMIVLYASMAAAQQLINLDEPSRPHLFIVIGMLLSMSLVPIALTRSSAPSLPEVSSIGVRRLYEASPLGFAGVFLSGAMLGSVYGLGPIFATQSGAGVSGAAMFMTVLIAGGVLLQWPFGWLSDIFDRRQVIIANSIAFFVMSLLLVAIPDKQGWLFSICAMLAGGLLFSFYPMAMAHTNDHIRKEEMVSASGGLILINSVASILGPLIAAAFMSWFGPGGLFIATGLASTGLAAFGLWRTRVRQSPAPEDQMNFHPVPPTTPVVVPLHPAHDDQEGNAEQTSAG